MTYHDFKRSDTEVMHWTNVVPGDLVHSPGALAILGKDFYAYCHGSTKERDDTAILTLADGVLLVLSRSEGCPGMENWDEFVTFNTFVVMSRHGLLVLMQVKK